MSKMEEWEEFGAAVSESRTCLTENNMNHGIHTLLLYSVRKSGEKLGECVKECYLSLENTKCLCSEINRFSC